jgi:hypothetical protein
MSRQSLLLKYKLGLKCICTVKSGNFVNFFAQNIFFTKLCEGTPHFFSGSKFIKSGLGVGSFGSWLTSKPLFFFIFLQVTKLPSWRVISSASYIPGLKQKFKPLQEISSAGSIFIKSRDLHKVIDPLHGSLALT